MGQPVSSCAWRNLGRATQKAPGAGDPRASGGCRPGACSACHRDHSPDRRSAARRAGLDTWLSGLARDTGILSRTCRVTRRNIPLNPALAASFPKTSGQIIRAAASFPTRLRRIRRRLGRCQGQVIQIAGRRSTGHERRARAARPAGPSAASELGQLGAWRRDAHPARTEIDDQDGVILDADDPAETVLIVCHLVQHGELLGRRSEGRDAEGTCGQEGPDSGARMFHHYQYAPLTLAIPHYSDSVTHWASVSQHLRPSRHRPRLCLPAGPHHRFAGGKGAEHWAVRDDTALMWQLTAPDPRPADQIAAMVDP
jgi:hypothetical protein